MNKRCEEAKSLPQSKVTDVNKYVQSSYYQQITVRYTVEYCRVQPQELNKTTSIRAIEKQLLITIYRQVEASTKI